MTRVAHLGLHPFSLLRRTKHKHLVKLPWVILRRMGSLGIIETREDVWTVQDRAGDVDDDIGGAGGWGGWVKDC